MTIVSNYTIARNNRILNFGVGSDLNIFTNDGFWNDSSISNGYCVEILVDDGNVWITDFHITFTYQVGIEQHQIRNGVLSVRKKLVLIRHLPRFYDEFLTLKIGLFICVDAFDTQVIILRCRRVNMHHNSYWVIGYFFFIWVH